MEVDLCQVFPEMLRNDIEDVDVDDWKDPQLCSGYVKDIYWYLRQLEVCLLGKAARLSTATTPLLTTSWIAYVGCGQKMDVGPGSPQV